jgi:hypothetical protein
MPRVGARLRHENRISLGASAYFGDARVKVHQLMKPGGTSRMVFRSLIGRLFGADAAAPPDAMKLDGTTEATLARSLSALPPEERGWITFAEARILFSAKDAQYAFGETDQGGRGNIESFAAQHRSVINFMPVEGRVYFVRDATAVTSIAT